MPAPTAVRVVRLRLGGTPGVQSGDGAWLPLAPLDAALLAWLALEGPTPRARLAALLWPGSDAEAARNSLRQRLFKMRRQSGADLAVGSATLALADGVEHDLEDAETVLGEFELSLGGDFDAWLAQQRQRRHERMQAALLSLCEMAEAAGDWPDALAHARELLSLAPLSEEAHRRVIRLHYLTGDRSAALLAFDRCERVLKDEVGIAPAPDTLALLRMVEAAVVPRPARLPAHALPPAVMRPPRLVGRDAEIAGAEAGWARGQVVALVGEAGMGKTRLLQHLLPEGALAVAARPGDAGVPLSTLARLLRALGEQAPQALPAPARREIARVLPGWDEAAAPAPAGQRLVLQRTVAAVLSGAAVVSALALDDLHFADPASLQMLLALLDEGAVPQRWLLAYRPAEAGSALQQLAGGLMEQARLQAVTLAPLSRQALAELVDALQLPGVHGEALAAGLLARTGGNPLYVLETLKQAWVDQTLGALATELPGEREGAAVLPRPAAVMRLVERRLTQLSAQALALARCAAVAGQDFSSTLAARVLGAPALALVDAWAELESAQILRDQAFVHDLIQDAALASVPAAIARQLHGEIAAHLEADGRAAAARIARHWLDAGLPARAEPQLERAAQDAARALEPGEAARMWSQLAELRSAAGDADAAFAAAGQAVQLLRSDTAGAPLGAAIDRLQALARSGVQRAQALEARATMHHMRGEVALAAAALEAGLAELPPDAPPQARVALLNMHGVVLRRAGRNDDARQAFDAALALARRVRDEGDLPAVLNNLGLLLQDQDEHLEAIALMQEAAARQPDPLVRARVVNNLATSLEERGQSALAREQCLAAARQVQGAAAVVELNLAIKLGAGARQLGRWRDALAHFEHADALLAQQPNKREEELHRQRALLWLDLGRPHLAREALERGASRAQGVPVDAALAATVQARIALAAGQDALPLLRPAESVLQAAGERRALRRLRGVLVQALPPEEALALLERLAADPAVSDNACARLPFEMWRAQALLALGRAAPAWRHAERAVDWLAAVQPLDVTVPEVWLTLARCALAAGETAAAAEAATRGADWLRRHADDHLDALYRDSCLQRNPVHRELLALAGRLAAT